MTVIFKILGFALAALLAAVLWLLIFPRKFKAEYAGDTGFTLKVKFAFVWIRVYPLPAFLAKKQDKRQDTREKDGSENTDQKKNYLKELYEKLEISPKLAKDVFSAAGGIMKRVLKGIKFKDVSFTLPVHSDTPYETRQDYGKVTAAFYSLCGVLQQFLPITFKSCIFVADFENQHQNSTYFYCQIHTAFVLLLAAAVFALKQLKLILQNNKKAPEPIKED